MPHDSHALLYKILHSEVKGKIAGSLASCKATERSTYFVAKRVPQQWNRRLLESTSTTSADSVQAFELVLCGNPLRISQTRYTDMTSCQIWDVTNQDKLFWFFLVQSFNLGYNADGILFFFLCVFF